jgi:hypothetical protein
VNQGFVGWSSPVPPNPLILIQDVKAQNTDGGTFTTGSFQTRTLNTLTDASGLASLASNTFTLPPGVYDYVITAPAAAVARHIARLQNLTDGVTTQYGTPEYAAANALPGVSRSIISGRLEIKSSKTFSIQHQCGTTGTTTGFGVASNFGPETYTSAEFRKIG